MHRYFLYTLPLVIAIVSVGCPKLIRTKKKEEVAPVYTSYDAENVEGNFVVYTRNFAYWKTAHDAVADSLVAGRKRQKVVFSYTIDYLQRMQASVPADKQYVFSPYFETYNALENMVAAVAKKRANKEAVRRKLFALKRRIVGEVSPYQATGKELFSGE